jgi:DNA-binding NarL/FixJ family response regulator
MKEKLTKVELEICNLLRQGIIKNTQLAEKMFVEETTIKNHLIRMYKKLDIVNAKSGGSNSKAELVYKVLTCL